MAMAWRHTGDACNTGSPIRWRRVTSNQTPARDRLGRAGWRTGPYYRGRRVTPVEGRGLSSRPAYQGAREPGDWREPPTSTEGSETPDDAACQSEGSAWLPILSAVRQGVPTRHPGVCLPAVPVQRRRAGGGRPDLRGD